MMILATFWLAGLYVFLHLAEQAPTLD